MTPQENNIIPPFKEKIFYSLCKNSFSFFCKNEMKIIMQPGYDEIIKAVLTKRAVLIEASRDCGKTTLIVVCYVLWRAKYYYEFFYDIIILTDSNSQKNSKIQKIRNQLINTVSFHHLLPYSISDLFASIKMERNRTYWNMSGIRLRNGVEIRVMPFVRLPRGDHPQLLICDDVVNENNSKIEKRKEDMIKHYDDVYVPMTVSVIKENAISQIIFLYTPAPYEGTLYSKVEKAKTITGDLSYFKVKVPAVTYTGRDWLKGKLNFPDILSFEKLIFLYNGMTSKSAFYREILLEKRNAEVRIIKWNLLERNFYEDVSYREEIPGTVPIAICLGADFGVPGTQNGDYTNYLVIRLLQDMRIQLFRHFRRNEIEEDEQILTLINMTLIEKVNYGSLEANNFQRLYSRNSQITQLGVLHPFVTTGDKHSWDMGLPVIKNMLRQEQIIFPYKTARDKEITDIYATELNSAIMEKKKVIFTSKHDDAAMALWIALRALTSFRSQIEGENFKLIDLMKQYNVR